MVSKYMEKAESQRSYSGVIEEEDRSWASGLKKRSSTKSIKLYTKYNSRVNIELAADFPTFL